MYNCDDKFIRIYLYPKTEFHFLPPPPPPSFLRHGVGVVELRRGNSKMLYPGRGLIMKWIKLQIIIKIHQHIVKHFLCLHEYVTTAVCVVVGRQQSGAFTLVLGTVPAGTCSRNMFSVHTISSSMNDVLKRIVPARTVPAGTWSNHVLGTKLPVSTPPEQIWTLRYREQCTKWAGLSTQTAISTESAHQMTSHVAQCIHNTSYCAARELCRLQIWTKRYREHFTVLVIWTLVYREHVPRTFCQGFVPRTYMNGLSVSIVATDHLLPKMLCGQLIIRAGSYFLINHVTVVKFNIITLLLPNLIVPLPVKNKFIFYYYTKWSVRINKQPMLYNQSLTSLINLTYKL